MKLSKTGPVFVVGIPRSGTTLVRKILNAHPDLHITHEASFYSFLSVSSRRNLKRTLKRYVRFLPVAWLNVTEEDLLGKDLVPSAENVGQIFERLLQSKAKQHGKPRYGDKTPFHIMNLTEIFRDFPDAKVIHVVRNPRDVISSLRRMPWGTNCVLLVLRFMQLAFAAIKPYRDRICEVRLEDLTVDPENQIRRMAEFIDLPWSDRMLNHDRESEDTETPPYPWLRNAGGRVSSNKETGETLSVHWNPIIQILLGKHLRTYDYVPPKQGRSWIRSFGLLVYDLGRLTLFLPRLAQLWYLMRYSKTLCDPQKTQQILLNINRKAWRHFPDFQMPRVGS